MHSSQDHFIGYEKIFESQTKWNLTPADLRAFKKTDWVVTEKIHGANFCITTDGSNVRFAKRKEFLQPGEDFFGFKSKESRLINQVNEIFKILQAEAKVPLKVFVYGELFGGEYPHPDVPSVTNVQAVQTGVYYSPDIEFCAFDIAIVENNNLASRNYKDYHKALTIFQQVGMMNALPLFVGKYETALAYHPEFDSTIPGLLGLPKLPFANKAEGIVIKPVKSFWLESAKGRIRPILKIKIPEFAEDSRFHQATKWHQQQSSNYSQIVSTEECTLPSPSQANLIAKLQRESENLVERYFTNKI
ncbi:RNA ligase family protein [Aerosakkonema sp. BLCC-F183]|uniref:RNA ligase family protein n=1 Tax=Aerosakkonema sp. BLCC-F183 TaxID=3342834 RepID=UPI0035BA2E67